MAARLGNVLHWVANTVAILLLVSGAITGWDEFLHGGVAVWPGLSLCAVAGR